VSRVECPSPTGFAPGDRVLVRARDSITMAGTVKQAHDDDDLLIAADIWIPARYTPVPDLNVVTEPDGVRGEPGIPHFFAEVSEWTTAAANAATAAYLRESAARAST
jgi:hypothetical protein